MAQELVVVLSCDVCGSREGVETFTVGGRALDACQGDATDLVREVVALFDKHSRPTDPPPSGKPSGGMTGGDRSLPVLFRSCPLCDVDPSPTRTAISQHVSSRHGRALAEAEAESRRRFVCLCGESLPTFQRLSGHIARATRKGTPGHGYSV